MSEWPHGHLMLEQLRVILSLCQNNKNTTDYKYLWLQNFQEKCAVFGHMSLPELRHPWIWRQLQKWLSKCYDSINNCSSSVSKSSNIENGKISNSSMKSSAARCAHYQEQHKQTSRNVLGSVQCFSNRMKLSSNRFNIRNSWLRFILLHLLNVLMGLHVFLAV
jgi:hypothetical protein